MSQGNVHIAKVGNFTATFFYPLKRTGVPTEKLLRGHLPKRFDIFNVENYVPLCVMYNFIDKVDQLLGYGTLFENHCSLYKKPGRRLQPPRPFL